MYDFDERLIRVGAFAVAGLLGAWTAWACHQAQQHGLPGSDAVVWAGLAAVFLLYSQLKLARGLGLFGGWGGRLRTIAKQHHLYGYRRSYQAVVTITVAVSTVVLLAYGLIWLWDSIKRYHLAIGFAGIAVGYLLIRIVSLHEVDEWDDAHPWAPMAADLIAAAGASAVSIARLSQLGEFPQL